MSLKMLPLRAEQRSIIKGHIRRRTGNISMIYEITRASLLFIESNLQSARFAPEEGRRPKPGGERLSGPECLSHLEMFPLQSREELQSCSSEHVTYRLKSWRKMKKLGFLHSSQP